MIALVPLLLLGGVVFVEQPLDGVETDLTQWRIRTETYTRCADLDGDGANDIITPTAAAFQRNGQFPKAQQTPLPNFDGTAYMDVLGNEIFVLLRDRIEVIRWAKSDWQRTLSQPIDWGDAVRSACFGSDPPAKSSAPLFEHFLFNADGDRSPEIVRVAFDGIHVFSKKDLFYAEAAVWQIVPPPKAYVRRGTLWPSAARHIEIPRLVSLATVRVEKDGVSIQTSMPAGIARSFYHQDYYAFDAARGLSLSSAPDRSIESEAVDRVYECTELNRDDVMDLIRVDITGETAAPLSMPIVETSVSTDGGKTFFTAKSLGAKPLRAVTDFNEDGRLDLVTENKRLVEGGIRETLVRGLTRREVDLEVAVRLQDETGGFPAKPTFSHTFTIELDKPPAYQSVMFVNFLRGGQFSLDGDFDGDGIRDAAIHDRPNRVAIRRGAPNGISSEVIATLPTSAQRYFAIVDIDGDGRSDLILSGGSDTEKTDGGNTVYLSRESMP